jgi:hypothetical protein
MELTIPVQLDLKKEFKPRLCTQPLTHQAKQWRLPFDKGAHQFRFEQTRQPERRPAGLCAWGRHRPADRAGEEEEPDCRGGPGLPFAPTPRHLSDTGPLSANTLQLHRGLCSAVHLCCCVVIVSVIFMSLFAHVAPPPSHKLEHQCWLAPISNRKLIGAELQRRVGLAFCR